MVWTRCKTSITKIAILGLLLTTSIADVPSLQASAFVEPPSKRTLELSSKTSSDGEDSQDTDSEDGGWFKSIVNTGEGIVSGARESTVSGASTVWNTVEQAPGAAWSVIEKTPGAIGGLASDGWNWFRDSVTQSVEWNGWAEFITAYPVIGVFLGPLVWILTGLSPDGTITHLEIGLGLFALLVPAVKGGQAIWKTTSWFPDAKKSTSTVRSNPGGLINGIVDTVRYSRATTIAPTSGEFAHLPNSPGVYVARDSTGMPLYVGMSNSLSRRVPQHFSGQASAFAHRTDSIKIIGTDSVADARALECRLIKQFMPVANVVHKSTGPCPVYTEILVPITP